MQDELKNVISQAMNANTNSEQELTEQLAEGELSDEALEAVAGGRCSRNSREYKRIEIFRTAICYDNANKLV